MNIDRIMSAQEAFNATTAATVDKTDAVLETIAVLIEEAVKKEKYSIEINSNDFTPKAAHVLAQKGYRIESRRFSYDAMFGKNIYLIRISWDMSTR